MKTEAMCVQEQKHSVLLAFELKFPHLVACMNLGKIMIILANLY